MEKKNQKKEVSQLVKNIKELRKKHSFTQMDLATTSGVPYTTLTKIEIGVIKEPSVYTCRDLAQALKVSIEALIGEEKAR